MTRGHIRNFRQVLERMELDPLAVVLGFRDLPFAPRLVRGRPLLVVVRAVVVLRRGDGGLDVDRTRIAGRLLDDVLSDLDLDLRHLASGLQARYDVLLVDGAALRHVPGPLLGPAGLDGPLDVRLRALVLRLRLAPVRNVRYRDVRVDGRSARARLPDDADGLVRSVGLRPVPQSARSLLDANLVAYLADAHGKVPDIPGNGRLRDSTQGLAHHVLRGRDGLLLGNGTADVPRTLLGRAGLHLVGLPAAGGARLRLRPVGHVLALGVPVFEDGRLAARADVADRLLRDFRDCPVPPAARRLLDLDAVADVGDAHVRVVDVAVDRRLGDTAQRLLLHPLRARYRKLGGLRTGDVPRTLLGRAGLHLVGLPAAGEVRLVLRPHRLVARLGVLMLEHGPPARGADVADALPRGRDVRDVVEPVGTELVPDLFAELEPGLGERIGRHGRLGRDDSTKPLPRFR